MAEKAADVRHFEHEDMMQRISTLEAEMKESAETISNFITRQIDDFADFRLELLKELRSIERSIASKCEQDSAIIATQNRELQRLDRVEGSQEETAKALAVVTENMRTLKLETDKSLGAAHEAIRGHGRRIEHLERRAGKMALKVIYGALGAAGVAAITWAVTRIVSGLSL